MTPQYIRSSFFLLKSINYSFANFKVSKNYYFRFYILIFHFNFVFYFQLVFFTLSKFIFFFRAVFDSYSSWYLFLNSRLRYKRKCHIRVSVVSS